MPNNASCGPGVRLPQLGYDACNGSFCSGTKLILALTWRWLGGHMADPMMQFSPVCLVRVVHTWQLPHLPSEEVRRPGSLSHLLQLGAGANDNLGHHSDGGSTLKMARRIEPRKGTYEAAPPAAGLRAGAQARTRRPAATNPASRTGADRPSGA